MDHRHPDSPLQVQADPTLLVDIHVFGQPLTPLGILPDVSHPVRAPVGIPFHPRHRLHQLVRLRIVRRTRWPDRIDGSREAAARIDSDFESVDRPTRIVRFLGNQRVRFLIRLPVVITPLASRNRHQAGHKHGPHHASMNLRHPCPIPSHSLDTSLSANGRPIVGEAIFRQRPNWILRHPRGYNLSRTGATAFVSGV